MEIHFSAERLYEMPLSVLCSPYRSGIRVGGWRVEARNSFGGSVGRICEIFVDRVVVPLLRGGNAAGFDMTDGEHYFRMDLANGRTDSRNFVRRKSRMRWMVRNIRKMLNPRSSLGS